MPTRFHSSRGGDAIAQIRAGQDLRSGPLAELALIARSRPSKFANKELAKAGCELLPERLTPHSLRRTFASLLFALGESPP